MGHILIMILVWKGGRGWLPDFHSNIGHHGTIKFDAL